MMQNRSVPKSTVIPQIAYGDVGAAADWLVAAFGFEVRLRIGNHRVQMHVGDGAVVLVERKEGLAQVSSVMVRVEDAEGHCARARGAGAKILMEPTDFPFGERQYAAEDFEGHRWTFTESIADVDPRDWGGEPGRL